ncbi:hypothetical protein EDD36DRAFT_231072 [Exophiala viscosa]|uniref:Uncharacterized protein n=1 Tax=Exophiala viscosa TaxID=2486360 RepID=A0AAN6DZT5_9EURO|nr:hypothetical protein EDD36DRAFT_231072 [Exophiala viscosa]
MFKQSKSVQIPRVIFLPSHAALLALTTFHHLRSGLRRRWHTCALISGQPASGHKRTHDSAIVAIAINSIGTHKPSSTHTYVPECGIPGTTLLDRCTGTGQHDWDQLKSGLPCVEHVAASHLIIVD